MTLEEGMRVKVRKGLEVEGKYGNHTFYEEMKRFRGKVVTIGSISSDRKIFLIKEDDQKVWSKEMVEHDVQLIIE